MAVIEQRSRSKGRNFTAEELVGRKIKIVAPDDKFPSGHYATITADDESIDNAYRVVVRMEAQCITEAIITLYRFDQATEGDVPTEIATARDDLEISFSAIVSDVR